MPEWTRPDAVQVMACRLLRAITWTNDALLSIAPLGTNFGEIWIEIQNLSFMVQSYFDKNAITCKCVKLLLFISHCRYLRLFEDTVIIIIIVYFPWWQGGSRHFLASCTGLFGFGLFWCCCYFVFCYVIELVHDVLDVGCCCPEFVWVVAEYFFVVYLVLTY